MNINVYYILLSLILATFIILITLNYLNKNNSIQIINKKFYKYSNNFLFFENLKRINKDFLVIKMIKIVKENEEYYFGEDEFKIKNTLYKLKVKIYDNSEIPIFEFYKKINKKFILIKSKDININQKKTWALIEFKDNCDNFSEIFFFNNIETFYLNKRFEYGNILQLLDCKEVTFINSNLSDIKNISVIFKFNNSEIIDFKGLKNTNNIKDISAMFYVNKNLKEIKHFNNLNTENCETFEIMFFVCDNLKTIDISHFNLKKCKSLNGLFDNCSILKEIKGLDIIDTRNVEDMSFMFYCCYSLEFIDISHFNTFKCKKINNLFDTCVSLKEIKGIENLNIDNIEDHTDIFLNCENFMSAPY